MCRQVRQPHSSKRLSVGVSPSGWQRSVPAVFPCWIFAEGLPDSLLHPNVFRLQHHGYQQNESDTIVCPRHLGGVHAMIQHRQRGMAASLIMMGVLVAILSVSSQWSTAERGQPPRVSIAEESAIRDVSGWSAPAPPGTLVSDRSWTMADLIASLRWSLVLTSVVLCASGAMVGRRRYTTIQS